MFFLVKANDSEGRLTAAMSQVPVPCHSVRFKFQISFDQKAYLGAECFFSYWNSECILDKNTFHLKDKKKLWPCSKIQFV